MFVNGFLDTISQYNMINTSDSILVGLSGGADSVCLLLNLLELKKTMNITVSAIHIHHGIRGMEADRDALFCKELCDRMNVPFILEYVDAVEYSKKNKLSVEEAARKLRYEVFAKYSANKKIAAAHNLPDNSETTMINMIRGTGLKGICGIPAVRDNIIRPLLFTSRTEIEEYLKQCNQKYVTDSTNLSTDYTRNKIRHIIIPEILKINNNFLSTCARNKKVLEQDEEFIEECTLKAYNDALCENGALKTEVLKNMHIAIRSRCISEFLRRNNLSVSYGQICKVLSILDGGKINYAEDVYITAKMGTLNIVKNEVLSPICRKISIGKNEFYNKNVNFEVVSSDKFDKNSFVHKNFANYYADYGKIQGGIVIRTRQNGDRFKLPSRDFTSSVKKLLQAKIPQNERQKLVFLQDDGGIIFIEKFGFTDRVRTDCSSEQIMLLTIE